MVFTREEIIKRMIRTQSAFLVFVIIVLSVNSWLWTVTMTRFDWLGFWLVFVVADAILFVGGRWWDAKK